MVTTPTVAIGAQRAIRSRPPANAVAETDRMLLTCLTWRRCRHVSFILLL